MATRQRLRAVLDARRASQPCWRCALNLPRPRYNSTGPAGILDRSKSMGGVLHDRISQQELESILGTFYTPYISSAAVGPVPRSLDESESGTSQTVHKPRIPVMLSSQSVPLGTRSKSPFTQFPPEYSLRRMSGRRPLSVGTRSHSQSRQTSQKPRIRVMSGGQPVALGTPPIRKVSNGTMPLLSIRKYLQAPDPEHLAGNRSPSAPWTSKYFDDVIKLVCEFEPEGNSIVFLAVEDVAAIRLVRISGPPLGERPENATEVPSKGQRQDEAFQDEVTSLLDVSRDLPMSRLPSPTGRIGKSSSGIRFLPQDTFNRQAPSRGNRTSNFHSLNVSERFFSARTPGSLKRHYATQIASRRRLLSLFHILKLSTEQDFGI